jgi:fatty acid kinase
MQKLDRLRAEDVVRLVTTYRDALRVHRERMNLLNVYPVPDGDTGTNMSLTLDSVVKEIEAAAPLAADGTRDMEAVARAMSHGSLMGARGNSGVILSQILRGLAHVFASAVPATAGAPTKAAGCSGPASADPGPIAVVDGPLLAEGLRRAREGAYQAVGNPVEGTILTVIRAAADAGSAAGPGLAEVLEAARGAAATALEQTPEMLPALKAAGVVDSGGYGLVLLFDAALHVVEGRPIPAVPPSPAPRDPGGRAANSDLGIGHRDGPTAAPATGSGPGEPHVASVSDLRYEVMFLLEAPDDSIPAFRRVWAGVGDSIVVVGGDGLFNCHIHTDDIGAAVEAGLDAGRPRQIRVSDLWDQVEEERWVREAGEPGALEDPVEPVSCAVVAVCNGEGIRRIFHSLGVQLTVAGGQSMNPSTADILAAIEAAPAEEVVILPNNKNIVPVAEAAAQAAAVHGKTVRVVPTVGIPEGFAALLEYDPEGNATDNAELMAASADRVVAGEVTVAVRDANSPAGPIRVGDWLGLSRTGIEVVAPGPADAAIGLLGTLVNDAHHEIATIIAGEGAQATDTRRITEWLAERWPAVGVEVHHGGQPLYPYLFSIE